MRLSISSSTASVGNVEIHETFRVIELDAGNSLETAKSAGLNGRSVSIPFSQNVLHDIETQLAIVVPCKDEDVSILDGVLHGIPRDCLIILVSNSTQENYAVECTLLTEFCADAHRSGIVAHQHDAGIAQAFFNAGMPYLVREVKHGLQVRNGKGEAMMIGTALAKIAGKQFIGFIDADNLVAGAVHEYCKVYAAGLHYALNCARDGTSTAVSAPHPMVRIKWNSKPKVKDGVIVFEKSGRCSRVVNEWMNRLLATLIEGDADQDMIQTGNAGEHAMSVELALELQFANGYAVEPFQYVDAWERSVVQMHKDEELRRFGESYNSALEVDEATYFGNYSGSNESSAFSSTCSSDASSPATSPSLKSMSATALGQVDPRREVQIIQVETRSPHFHDTSKGGDHIAAMQVGGLSTIYHSCLTPQKLKDELREYIKEHLSEVKGVAEDGTPAAPRCYPAMSTMDFDEFRVTLEARQETLKVFGCGGKW
ncbi:hypothetical protein ACEQ8H_008876 [Pleosporales sp. CAS-2024a]